MFKRRTFNHLDFRVVSLNNAQQTPATLENIEYRCQIINNILKTKLIQTFRSQSRNEYSETLYYFPIEEGICLESFVAKYQDKTIKGIVKEKDQAKKEYTENKSQGNFVSYASVQKSPSQDYVNIKLGNLPPNQQVEIELIFSQQLCSILNKFYIAEIPLHLVQDQIQSKFGKKVLTLDLLCTGRITYAVSKDSFLKKTTIDENTVKFTLDSTNNDLHIKYCQIIFSFEGMFDPQVIFGSSKCYHEDKVKRSILPVGNSAMVTFIPNFNEDITNDVDDSIKAALKNGEDITSDEFLKRMSINFIDHLDSSRSEFLFLLDRSGSMDGRAIERAREALILFLKSLPTNSYFNVISFGTQTDNLFPQSLQYTNDNLQKAIRTIGQYRGDLGGTNIYSPLAHIFQTQRIKGYNRQIVLLTDGAVESPKEVIGLLKKNSKFNRIHTLGFGSGADRYLIEQSAIAGKGSYRIVDFSCDLSTIIIEILSCCITPFYDDFQVQYDQNIFNSVYPSKTNFPCVLKDEIVNIHFFFKPLIDLNSLTQEQKRISIQYFDSRKQQVIRKDIRLEMADSFSYNHELQESVFKLGKQLQLNELINPQTTQDDLIQEAVDFQLLTEKTAIICIIESLNDVSKVIYDNSSNQKVYGQQQNHLTNSFYSGQNNNILLDCDDYDTSVQFNCLKQRKSQNHNTWSLDYFVQNQQCSSSIDQLSCHNNKNTYNIPRHQQSSLKNDSSTAITDLFSSFQSSSQKSFNIAPPPMKAINPFQSDLLDLECFSSLPPVTTSSNIGTQQQTPLPSQTQKSAQINLLDLFDDDIPQPPSILSSSNPVTVTNSQSNKQEQQQKQKGKKQLLITESSEDEDEIDQWFNKRSDRLITIPDLENLLNSVDSQGTWKFDEQLIQKSSKLDQNSMRQFYLNFSEKDAFMTLFVLVILELYYSAQQTKWFIISKKSLNYIKKQQLNKTTDLESLKQSLKTLIKS